MLHIRTGSRLHFGLFGLGDAPRPFGGVGLMIAAPGIKMCATPAREGAADGPLSERVLQFARRWSRTDPSATPQHFLIGSAAPEHVGLGTGTQLGLATGRLLAEACGVREGAPELARRVGRGLRSALGIHGFERGGFLVEAGQRTEGGLSPLVAHASFPEDWRIVMVIPPHTAGLHGFPEQQAFAQLSGSLTQTDALCRLTLLGMLPAIQEHDVQAFGEALHEFNARVGEMFVPVQGGVYSDAGVECIVAFLRGEGVAGVGQSSWGPAVFAVVADAERAGAVAVRVRERFSYLLEASVFVARAMNRGAMLSLE
jgi:beta-ribofuranosylaminobenzene 5'-phosphate synthase